MPKSNRLLSVEDLWSIKRVGVPTLSPDGSSACAAVSAYDMDTNEGRTELWLFATDGAKARRLTAGDKDSEPCWSPTASGSHSRPSARTTRSRRSI